MQHGGVGLLPLEPPKSDDPLRFWTSHPTEKFLVDLHPFANGEFENPSPIGPNSGAWGGPFTGRPNLIAEVTPAIQARCDLIEKSRVKSYLASLRTWWRLFDAIESASTTGDNLDLQVTSVA